jgi:hypothetical protein
MLGARKAAVAVCDKARRGLDCELITETAESGHGPVGYRRQD